MEDAVQHYDTVVGRIWHCMRTVDEMLKDRGYSVTRPLPNYTELTLSLLTLDLADATRAQMLMNQFQFEVHRQSDGKFLLVQYLCGKVGVKTESMQSIKNLFPQFRDNTTTEQKKKMAAVEIPPDVILLVQLEGCNITAPALKDCAKYPAVIEVFHYKQLMCNITHHCFQPKFRVMSELEKEEVKRKYCCKDSQLPKLLWEDPIRYYFGLKEGDMLSCTRLADVGKEPYYRIVQPPSVSKKKNKK